MELKVLEKKLTYKFKNKKKLALTISPKKVFHHDSFTKMSAFSKTLVFLPFINVPLIRQLSNINFLGLPPVVKIIIIEC